MQAGALEIFLDNLPGFPDGVSRASDGNFWVAINSAPVPKVVGVTMGSRFLRWVVGWVPALAGELNAYGLILKVSDSSEPHFSLLGLYRMFKSRARKAALINGIAEC